MYRLEVFRNNEKVVTEWCVEQAHLRGVMGYYISVRPDQTYKLYDPKGALILSYYG